MADADIEVTHFQQKLNATLFRLFFPVLQPASSGGANLIWSGFFGTVWWQNIKGKRVQDVASTGIDSIRPSIVCQDCWGSTLLSCHWYDATLFLSATFWVDPRRTCWCHCKRARHHHRFSSSVNFASVYFFSKRFEARSLKLKRLQETAAISFPFRLSRYFFF